MTTTMLNVFELRILLVIGMMAKSGLSSLMSSLLITAPLPHKLCRHGVTKSIETLTLDITDSKKRWTAYLATVLRKRVGREGIEIQRKVRGVAPP